MNPATQIRNRFRISTNTEEFNLSYIHHYLSHDSYWASGIPMDTVKRSIANSLCFGVFEKDKQVGFARVISDGPHSPIWPMFLLRHLTGGWDYPNC